MLLRTGVAGQVADLLGQEYVNSRSSNSLVVAGEREASGGRAGCGRRIHAWGSTCLLMLANNGFGRQGWLWVSYSRLESNMFVDAGEREASGGGAGCVRHFRGR